MDPLLAYLVTMLAAVVGSTHWLARPHLFTYLGVVLVMERLERSEEGARPWTYLPIFAVWANLHGGFLFGLIVIGIYLAGDLAEALRPDARAYWLARARRHAAALGFAALGTLINPYGVELPGPRAELVQDGLPDRHHPGVPEPRLPPDHRQVRPGA